MRARLHRWKGRRERLRDARKVARAFENLRDPIPKALRSTLVYSTLL